LPKAIFEKNVTSLAKFARVLSESREFGASGYSLKITQLLTKLTGAWHLKCNVKKFNYFFLILSNESGIVVLKGNNPTNSLLNQYSEIQS
jgi:hypothetical protein